MRWLNAGFLFVVLTSALFGQTPKIADNGVLNGATFQQGEPVTPGALISIFGTELSSSIASADTIPFSTTLAGVSVTLSNQSQSFQAPLSYVQPTQINAQVPWNLLPGASPSTFNLVVTLNGVASPPVQVSVGPFSPGIFAINGRAAIANVDHTFAWPVGLLPGAPSHPAKPGDVVIMYATGLGAVDSPVQDGAASLDRLRNTLVKPVVLIGGISANVLFSGLSPQFPGVNQLNVVVPNVAASDNVPVQLQIGGITTSNAITIAVSQ